MILSRRGFLGALAASAASLVVPKKSYFFGMGLPALVFDVDLALRSSFLDGRRWARMASRDAWIEVWTGRVVTSHQLFLNGGMKPTDENLDRLADATEAAVVAITGRDEFGRQITEEINVATCPVWHRRAFFSADQKCETERAMAKALDEYVFRDFLS